MHKHIIIVGGGTAGWSTAAILSTNTDITITILDPSNIPIIGVGESTLPHLHLAHRAMKLPILQTNEWANSVDATIKLGIGFENFYTKNSRWLHPFLDAADIDRITLAKAIRYGYYKNIDNQWDFASKYTWAGSRLKNGFIERTDWFTNYKTAANGGGGAFHINAVKYSALLKTTVKDRPNVRLIDSVVSNIKQNDLGEIESIVLDNGQQVTADLYIDCTGFASILSNAVESPWTSVSDRLFVDQALVVQLPYIKEQLQKTNLTTCTGLSSGWVFNIPLDTRIGTGYIHASRYIDSDNAKLEFKDYLTNRWGYNLEDIDLRLIKFRTGFRPNLWHKNVVSVGLSGFFCEPIESTAIAIANYAVMLLNEYIQTKNIPLQTFKDKFNLEMKEQHNDILDFVTAHYQLTARDDSAFWKDYKNLPLPNNITNLMNEFVNQHRESTLDDNKFHSLIGRKVGMFHLWSYTALFLGNKIIPQNCKA